MNYQHFLRSSALAAALAMSVSAVADEPVEAANLPIKDAERLVEKATESANKLGARVCIAVSDAGGTLLAYRRMDGAPPGCTASAIGKAHGSAIYRAPTAVFMDMVNKGQPAVGYLPELVPIGGGVPLSKGSKFHGAVGIAGSSIENEIKIATEAANQL